MMTHKAKLKVTKLDMETSKNINLCFKNIISFYNHPFGWQTAWKTTKAAETN